MPGIPLPREIPLARVMSRWVTEGGCSFCVQCNKTPDQTANSGSNCGTGSNREITLLGFACTNPLAKALASMLKGSPVLGTVLQSTHRID